MRTITMIAIAIAIGIMGNVNAAENTYFLTSINYTAEGRIIAALHTKDSGENWAHDAGHTVVLDNPTQFRPQEGVASTIVNNQLCTINNQDETQCMPILEMHTLDYVNGVQMSDWHSVTITPADDTMFVTLDNGVIMHCGMVDYRIPQNGTSIWVNGSTLRGIDNNDYSITWPCYSVTVPQYTIVLPLI